MPKDTTVVAISRKDYRILKSLRRMRTTIPPKKPGRGREPGLRENCAEVMHRIIQRYVEEEVR